MNIASNMQISDNANKILFFEIQREQLNLNNLFNNVLQRLHQRNQFGTFNTCQKKTKCTLGNKLVKLREDRQLLARFLIVKQP